VVSRGRELLINSCFKLRYINYIFILDSSVFGVIIEKKTVLYSDMKFLLILYDVIFWSEEVICFLGKFGKHFNTRENPKNNKSL